MITAKEEVIQLGDVSAMKEAFLPKIRKTVNWKLILFLICGITGLLIIMLGVIVVVVPGASTLGLHPVDFFIVGTLIIIGPIGFYMSREMAVEKDLERRLPEFLRDIAESGKFGMTLAASIQAAAKGRYGSLTPHIKRMSSQISWGVSAVESIKLFQESVDTRLTERVVSLVVKAATSGGNVSDVLTIVAQDTKEGQYLQDERGQIMLTYLTVIYISYMVFLVTVLILNQQFIPQMEKVLVQDESTESQEDTEVAGATQASAGFGSSGMTAESLQDIKNLYIGAAIVHGLGDGIVAGILFTGRWQNGLQHSFIMVIMSYVMLRPFLV